MMDPDLWRRVEPVLDRVLGSDPSGWPSLLDETCSSDLTLRAEVEALLTHYPAAKAFLMSRVSIFEPVETPLPIIRLWRCAVLAALVRRREAQNPERDAEAYRRG